MRRSTSITWDQLKVGALILVAFGIIGFAIYRLGQSANLFTRRYSLVTLAPATAGLRVGGQVTIAGQLVGTVKEIAFLPVDEDTMRNLRITVELDRNVQDQVRRDSRATLRTMGLLGDKVYDISPGTPTSPTLRDGDTLRLVPALDYEAVLAQASGVIREVRTLTVGLQGIVTGVSAGKGTIGALVTRRDMYDQLNSTLASTNSLMLRLQNPNGTVGRLLNDPALYHSLDRLLLSADSVVGQVASSQGTVGRLLRDDDLYLRLVATVASLDTLVGSMSRGEGTMQKLFTDDQLYDRVVRTVTELNNVLVDVRRDPRRYTRGLITIF